DEGTFKEFNKNLIGKDPLEFPGYAEKLDGMRKNTGLSEAIVTGECEIGKQPCVIAVMDGFFMMGSMGAALGEKFALAVERAIKKKLPLIAFTVSGGARMQEGLVSLMQMSKTAAVLGKMDETGLPYIVVLTDPTTGGVTASFGMLGDVTISEPNAVIGFAGRRVIEQTVKQVLPQTFQRAEFLQEKGFVDIIAKRSELPSLLANLIKMHMGGSGS
ncbi:acetyl-CoA carboxylase carboxyl transferase subunit beta, partial [Christensenellaceae bacterium OttesenSCG-928-K19]|nr:acetyl-CoA carboxylase carboxyl transferase subunit beta [Christensenellaceae bacterium OttesenSCG-928-K19]